jgi:hypothetical protein
MIRAWLIAAAVAGFLSVAAGAAAAHLPAGERGAELLRTGALYGMVHAAALTAVMAMAQFRDRLGLALTGCQIGRGRRTSLTQGSQFFPRCPRWRRRARRRGRLLRLVIGRQRSMVFGDAAVQRRHPLLQPPFGQDAGFAGIAVKERTVERHQFAAQQLQAAGQQHKLSIGRPQPGRVVPRVRPSAGPEGSLLRKLAIVRSSGVKPRSSQIISVLRRASRSNRRDERTWLR